MRIFISALTHPSHVFRPHLSRSIASFDRSLLNRSTDKIVDTNINNYRKITFGIIYSFFNTYSFLWRFFSIFFYFLGDFLCGFKFKKSRENISNLYIILEYTYHVPLSLEIARDPLIKIQTRETVSRGVPMLAATILRRNRSFREGSCGSVDARVTLVRATRASRRCSVGRWRQQRRGPAVVYRERPTRVRGRRTRALLQRFSSAKIATCQTRVAFASLIIVECRREDRLCASLAITRIRSYPPP